MKDVFQLLKCLEITENNKNRDQEFVMQSIMVSWDGGPEQMYLIETQENTKH